MSGATEAKPSRPTPTARVAGLVDRPQVISTLVSAFLDDPVWTWAFPDADRRPAQYEVLWGVFVDNALPHGWVWITEHAEAAAVWFPPETAELSSQDEGRLPSLLRQLVGERAPALMELFALFDAARPAEPHYYLDLFGTHADHRGRGLGMGLLRHTLSLIDQQKMPAYLESSNPVNDARYGAVGFVPHGRVRIPDGPAATTMWRPARQS
jgi:GNAT superfamily N-acetyltransferase